MPGADSGEAVLVAKDVYYTRRLGGAALPVLSGITLQVDRGELCALIGPSGCGKSTLLDLMAGLADPDAGEIRVHGKSGRKILGQCALMPQTDALLPWRTVRDNVALGAYLLGQGLGQARQRADRLLGQFHLDRFANERPDALSGGMRQRVALLRTALCERPAVLLDEPLGQLDALTRAHAQRFLAELYRESAAAVLMVTHDMEEAILLADRIVVLSARPAQVVATFHVDLPRPRPRVVLASEMANSLRAGLWEALGGDDSSSPNAQSGAARA